jgi:hypothetical protein
METVNNMHVESLTSQPQALGQVRFPKPIALNPQSAYQGGSSTNSMPITQDSETNLRKSI